MAVVPITCPAPLGPSPLPDMGERSEFTTTSVAFCRAQEPGHLRNSGMLSKWAHTYQESHSCFKALQLLHTSCSAQVLIPSSDCSTAEATGPSARYHTGKAVLGELAGDRNPQLPHTEPPQALSSTAAWKPRVCCWHAAGSQLLRDVTMGTLAVGAPYIWCIFQKDKGGTKQRNWWEWWGTISAHCVPCTVLLVNPNRDEALPIGSNQARLAAHHWFTVCFLFWTI